MAFHVACPITCRRVCDCELGFGAAAAARKGGGGGAAAAAVWAGAAAALEGFLADPWVLRPAGAVDAADAATVQVEVPPLEPDPEDGEDEARRAAAQRGAAAAEDLARRFESGAYGSPEAEGDEDEWDREDQGNAAVKVMCRLCFSGENEGSTKAAKMLPCKLCSKRYHKNCLKSWGEHRDLCAIKLTFYRILFFYCLSVLLVGMIVPYNASELTFANKHGKGASASPFVVAIKLAGIPYLDSVLNGAILLFVFSASNSDLYIASRTLYGLASDGDAPAIFKRTDRRGVPVYALGFSALFALLAYMNVSDDSTTVFGYFVNLVTIFGLLTWISILVTHIWFVRARRAQGIADSDLVYTAPLGIWGSYGALAMCCLVALTKNYDVFTGTREQWRTEKYKNFITGYIGIPIYLALLFGHKFMTKSRGVRPHECDFYTGKDIIDREEEEFLARKAEKMKQFSESRTKGTWFYKKFISWLF